MGRLATNWLRKCLFLGLAACVIAVAAQAQSTNNSTALPPSTNATETTETAAVVTDIPSSEAGNKIFTDNTTQPADSTQKMIINPFTGVAMAAPPSEDDDTQICQGKEPANVIIERVVSFPINNDPTTIVLRNTGGQTANLKGWKLMDNTGDKSAYVFGAGNCTDKANYTINPGRFLALTPRTRSNPCGYNFAVNFRDSVKLVDVAGKTVASAEWESSKEGVALHTFPDGTRKMMPETKDVLAQLEVLGEYTILLEALKVTGLDTQVSAASDPAYAGPELPEEQKEAIIPQFPWWFGFSVDRTSAPPPPAPPPPAPAPKPGVPPKGPYTLLAPNDDAFNALLANLGGMGQRLPKEELFKLPELKDILLYHIVPGRYTSDYFFNNSAVVTAKGVEVVPFTDPCMSEGSIMLHDACIDKPTPDQFSCKEQLLYDKCYFPFMTSALAAQWQGGFCQRTCQRCTCSPDSGIVCAKILEPDLVASNGIVHGISRTLFPPPVFEKVVLAPALDPSTYMSTDALPGMGDTVDAAAALTGLPVGQARAGASALAEASRLGSTSEVVAAPPAANRTAVGLRTKPAKEGTKPEPSMAAKEPDEKAGAPAVEAQGWLRGL